MTIKKIENQVVLCGYNSFNAYGMLRSLGEAGISPTLIINRCAYPFLAKSRYAKNGVFYFDNPQELPGLIRKHIRTAKAKPIVICCDDPLQSVMDCNYDDFKDEYLLSNCNGKQGEITRLMDKDVQMDIASRCGVIVPKTWKIKKSGSIPSDMIYPCIAKPELSINGSKAEIKVCQNQEELMQVISNRNYLVQEYIDKDYEAIIWGSSLSNRSYYVPGISTKIRQYPDRQGVTSYGVMQPFNDKTVIDLKAINEFLHHIHYTGMFSIEFAIKGNIGYLLEINLRNDGLQYFSTAAGANLPYIYINSLLGREFVEPTITTPLYFMGEITDFKQIFRKKVSTLGWLGDLFRTKCFFIFNWRDPKPFVYQLSGKLLSRFHK